MSTEATQDPTTPAAAAATLYPGEEAYEEEHVHSVYEQIASHFSSTRYKPWPIIERFLQNLEPGSVGLDVGCGNGKYLAVNRDVFIVASDRSTNLAAIAAQHQPHAVAVADILALPHPAHAFDFAISIAVVHHLSTSERRSEAIASILAHLRPGGKALVYVWALEQEGSRRGWGEGGEQDVMVPWVMKGKVRKKVKGRRGKKGGGGEGEGEKEGETEGEQQQQESDRTFHRYYHLYRQGELEENVREAGGVVVESGYEKDNWWAIAERALG